MRSVLLPFFLVPALVGTVAAVDQYAGWMDTVLSFGPGSVAGRCEGALQRTLSSAANVTVDFAASQLAVSADSGVFMSIGAPVKGGSDGKGFALGVTALDGSLLLALWHGAVELTTAGDDPCQPKVRKVLAVEEAMVLGEGSGKGDAAVKWSATVVVQVALPEGQSAEVRVGMSAVFQETSAERPSRTTEGATGTGSTGTAAAPTLIRQPESTSQSGATTSASGGSPTSASPPSSTGALTTSALTSSSSTSSAPTEVSSSTTPSPTTVLSTAITSETTSPSAVSAAAAFQTPRPLPAGSIAALTISVATIISLIIVALIWFIRRRRSLQTEKRKSGAVFPQLAYLYDAQRGPSPSGSEVSSVLELGATRKPPEPHSPANEVPRPAEVRLAETRMSGTRMSEIERPQIRGSEQFFHPAYRSGVQPRATTPFDDREDRREMVIREGTTAGIRVVKQGQNFI